MGGGTDEFLLHSKLHLPLVLMESVQSADGSSEGGWEDIVAMEIKPEEKLEQERPLGQVLVCGSVVPARLY